MSTWRSNVNANSNQNRAKDAENNDDWETDPDFVVSNIYY